ncbi:MAG: hypothetical protein M3067_05515 [Chloroflexota bacterium]|nr:hypothetical protein [Chloroflexota bacterium]
MRTRANHAPTMLTILVAIVLVIAGVLGTFLNYLPNQVGVIAFIVAGVLVLVGVLVRGI